MSEDSKDIDQIIRWIEGDLSEEEMKDFQSDPDYATVMDEVDTWSLPSMDVADGYEKLKAKRIPKGKVISWYQTTSFRVAASVVFVMCSVFYWMKWVQLDSVTTQVAESKEIVLPDESWVYLGASSFLVYDAEEWGEERKLKLKGTAFFDVKKGKTFEVDFGLGQVTVLGTSFEVKSFEGFALVMCYEGRVSVGHGLDEVIITKGEGVKVFNDQLSGVFEFENASWESGFSRFYTTPLSVIFQSLERDYQVKLRGEAITPDQTFTGTYPTTDLVSALDVIASTMGLRYEITDGIVTFVIR